MSESLGTAYDGQDDINEKLVLDLAWERQQKKVMCPCTCMGRGGSRSSCRGR